MEDKKQPPEYHIYNNHIYKYINQCNDNLYLYEEQKCKYKSAFDSFQLGLITSPKLNLRAHRNIF